MKIKNGHVKLTGAEQVRYARLRRKLLNKAGHRCNRCGKAGRLEIHHRQPIHKGGEFWDERNLEVLCRLCHIEHHRSEVEGKAVKGRREWLRYVREL